MKASAFENKAGRRAARGRPEKLPAISREVTEWKRSEELLTAIIKATAGLTGGKAAREPNRLTCVMVGSVAATVEAFVAKGGRGRLVPPIGLDVPEMTASFSDPARHVFGRYRQPRGRQ
jgi:hypothetical protein